MAHVSFTRHLRRFFPSLPGGEAEIAAGDLRALVAALDVRFPGLARYLTDETGALRKHVVLFVNGEVLTDRRHLTDPLGPDAEVQVFQALSGG